MEQHVTARESGFSLELFCAVIVFIAVVFFVVFRGDVGIGASVSVHHNRFVMRDDLFSLSFCECFSGAGTEAIARLASLSRKKEFESSLRRRKDHRPRGKKLSEMPDREGGC